MTDTKLLDLVARAEAGDKDAMQVLYKRAARADDAVPDKLSLAITTASDGMTNVRITARPATPSVPRNAKPISGPSKESWRSPVERSMLIRR